MAKGPVAEPTNMNSMIDAKTNEIVFDDGSAIGDATPTKKGSAVDGHFHSSGLMENNNVASLLRSQSDAIGAAVGDQSERASVLAESMIKGSKLLESSRSDLLNDQKMPMNQSRNANQTSNQTNQLVVKTSEDIHGRIEGVAVSRQGTSNKSIG